MTIRSLRFSAVFFLSKCLYGLCIVVLLTVSIRGEESNENQTLKPPAGYPSLEMIKLAWLTGQLKTVDRELAVPESVTVEKDIEYGRGQDVSLQLDLYSPKEPTKDVPGLIFVHGGGWKKGHRNDYRYYCIKFAEQGYVVATISYRLRDVAPFPAAVEDAKCAVRWMRSNAKKIGVDPDRIAILGGSAGGHLSMMVGYSSDKPELEGNGGHQDVSSRVQAVVNLYGPSDLTTPEASVRESVVEFLDGKSIEESPEVYQLASPSSHISSDDPATLILHGTIDKIVPIAQSDQLDQRLTDSSVPHEYHRLEGWPHTMDVAAPVNEYCFKVMSAFFEKHLSNELSDTLSK